MAIKSQKKKKAHWVHKYTIVNSLRYPRFLEIKEIYLIPKNIRDTETERTKNVEKLVSISHPLNPSMSEYPNGSIDEIRNDNDTNIRRIRSEGSIGGWLV